MRVLTKVCSLSLIVQPFLVDKRMEDEDGRSSKLLVCASVTI